MSVKKEANDEKTIFCDVPCNSNGTSLVSISAANVSVSSTASNPKTDISPKTASEIVALSFMKNSLNSNIEISETTPYSFSIADGILDWANSSINTNSVYKITGFGNGSDYWLMTDLAGPTESVCAPTAATNLMWYWGVQRGHTWVLNSSKTGLALAKLIFGNMKHNMWTSSSLGTLDSAVRGAYVNYLSPKGKNYNTKIVTQNNYNSFVTALNDNCPIHTMLRASSSITSSGHDVMAFGYGKSTAGTNYLFVMDGWYDYGRFVKFNYFPVIKGVKVWVGG